MSAVVHTIGTLFEKSGYKSAVKDGSVPRVVSSAVAAATGCGGSANPLEKEEKRREGSYALVNRDSGACFTPHRDVPLLARTLSAYEVTC